MSRVEFLWPGERVTALIVQVRGHRKDKGGGGIDTLMGTCRASSEVTLRLLACLGVSEAISWARVHRAGGMGVFQAVVGVSWEW